MLLLSLPSSLLASLLIFSLFLSLCLQSLFYYKIIIIINIINLVGNTDTDCYYR